MQCRTHPDHNGVNTCNQCGDWLCEDCTVEINGRIFCRRCLAQLAGEGSPSAAPSAAPRSSTARHAPAARRINLGLLLLFSFPPGINYMYEGLIKRGLAAMSGFFLLVYMTSIFHSTWPLSLIFGLTFPVYLITCFFDGLHIRRRINAGEAVSDDVDDILNFIKRNSRLIVAFVALILGLSLANALLFSGSFYHTRQWLPIILIILGLYVLFKRPSRRRSKHHHDHDHDHNC